MVVFSSHPSDYPIMLPFWSCSYSPPTPVSLPYWSPLLQSVASDMLSDRVCRSAHWSLCSSRLRWFQEEASLDNTESAPRFVQDRSFCPGQKVLPGSGYHGRVSQHWATWTLPKHRANICSVSSLAEWGRQIFHYPVEPWGSSFGLSEPGYPGRSYAL